MRWSFVATSLVLVVGAVACGRSKHKVTRGLTGSGGTSAAAGAAGEAETGGSNTGGSSAAGANSGGANTGGAGGSGAGGTHSSTAGAGGGAVTAGTGSGAAAGHVGSNTGGDAGDGAAGEGGSGAILPVTPNGDLTDADGNCVLFPTQYPAIAKSPPRVVVGGTTLTLSDHDCNYSFTKSIAVPLDGGVVRLLFHYDVNGDGIDDLFVSDTSGGKTKATIVESKLDANGVLSFEPTGCTLDVPNGNAYLVRDVDGDSAPDLVIGKPNGVLVLASRAGGHEVTVDYDFDGSSGARASLMDAAVVDIDRDGKPDLAVGFDRSPDGLENIETGVLLFNDAGTANALHGPAPVTDTDWSTTSSTQPNPIELGYLASFNSGQEFIGLDTGNAWDYGGPGEIVTLPATPNMLGSLLLSGQEYAFVAMKSSAGAFYARSGANVLSLNYTLSFVHDGDRDYGGGPRRYSTYLFDLDGDGDQDLVETNVDDATAPPASVKFAIHAGDFSAGPSEDAQTLVPPGYLNPQLELPFLSIGAAQGRLFVSDYDADTKSPLRVTGLACE